MGSLGVDIVISSYKAIDQCDKYHQQKTPYRRRFFVTVKFFKAI